MSKHVVYDNISWHTETDDFPPEVPRENAGIHMCVFLSWMLNNDLHSDSFNSQNTAFIEDIKGQRTKPIDFLVNAFNEEIRDEYFTEEGNRFAEHYYSSSKYFKDYAGLLGRDTLTIYHVKDPWKVYEVVEPIIDQRFSDWKKGKKPWQFWK